MAKIITEKLPTLDELKEKKIEQVKKQAHSTLSETDWYIVRKDETDEEIPDDVLDERQSIREQSETMEKEIENLETKKEVKDYTIEYNIRTDLNG